MKTAEREIRDSSEVLQVCRYNGRLQAFVMFMVLMMSYALL